MVYIYIRLDTAKSASFTSTGRIFESSVHQVLPVLPVFCAKARFSSFSFFKEFLDRTSKKASTSGGRNLRDPEKIIPAPDWGLLGGTSKIEVVGCYKNCKELLHVL
jgi:hypothetical protein